MSNPITNPAITQLSRRELFAAMALQGLLAHSTDHYRGTHLAGLAVDIADKLIEELAKPKAPQVHEWTQVLRGEEGNEYHRGFIPCVHEKWTDMEHGLGQCNNCMRMLPYAAFGSPPVTGCAHMWAPVGDGIMACSKCNYRGQ